MIVYEITARVGEEHRERFENYMRERHIPDLCATGHFESAEMARSDEGLYRIRYLAAERSALERYMREDAGRLREEFVGEFPEGVEVSREILEVICRIE